MGAWVIFQNIMQYSLLFGIAQSQIARSKLSFFRGITMVSEELFYMEKKLFIYAYSINTIIALLMFLNRSFISSIFTSLPEIKIVLQNLLLPFSFYMVILMN